MFEAQFRAANQNLILSTNQLIKYSFHLEANTSSCQLPKKTKEP